MEIDFIHVVINILVNNRFKQIAFSSRVSTLRWRRTAIKTLENWTNYKLPSYATYAMIEKN